MAMLLLGVGCRSKPIVVVPVEEIVMTQAHVPLEILKAQALEGSVVAMVTLGYRYECGEGVQRNDELAAEWYMQAANERDPEATYRLALLYANPQSTVYNFRSGKAWLRRATRMGHIKAKVKLHAYPRRPPA